MTSLCNNTPAAGHLEQTMQDGGAVTAFSFVVSITELDADDDKRPLPHTQVTGRS